MTHETKGTPRRARRFAAALAAAATILAACGGGGDSSDESAAETTAATSDAADTTLPDATETTTPDAAATTVPADSAPETTVADACPDLAESLQQVNDATYAVYGEVIVQGANGPELAHFQIGTAWGVDRRLLVTNAHVTQAFVDFAEQGVQLERALAIQAGTGEVVELLRQLTHPDYNGDPLRSPDVGLFTTRDEVTKQLELADDDVSIELGDEIQIVGFPGDVTDFIEVIPGETVPQATSLNGQVTALRAHDDTQEVTGENLDVVQHQAPTTPGTSGSSMVSCGRVIGVNNAGTVNLIATPAPDGSLTIDRQAAAANNFGVHVRHIRELIELFDDNALQGAELPAPAVVQAAPPPVSGGDTNTGDPGGAQTLVLGGQVGEPFAHGFAIEVDLNTGATIGVSDWAGNQYNIQGQVFADGSFLFVDDAAETSGGELRRGIYEGVVTSESTIEGVYYEEGDEGGNQAPFTAAAV